MTYSKRNTPLATRKPVRSRWWKLGYSLWLALNIIVAVGLICSSYAGVFNPAEVTGAGIVGMTLPGWSGVAVFLTVFNLIWWRRTSLLLIMAMLVCAKPLWYFCPLNLPPGKLSPEEAERSFTLLTYNTLGLMDQESQPGPHRTLEYILDQDADIVCIQELYFVSESESLGVTAEQVAALHKRYPYIVFTKSQCVMSKYPLSALHIDYCKPDTGCDDFAAYQIDVDGHLISVFNCHFQSIGLTGEDKQLYTRITDGHANRNSVNEVSNHLLAKLMHANRKRARQIEMIGRYIKHYGGENVIVCGDFNDVPDCFGLRRLAEFNLQEVYPQVGFGPMITYNANRFYFRIDHVLYRGCFKAHSMVRGSLKSSDHYPLTTTFVFND